MSFGSRRFSKSLRGISTAVVLCALPAIGHAQTWVNNRPGPSLRELLTIDETGEVNWLWGTEDVGNDGLNVFAPAEQAIDARTAYVNTDSTRLFSRVYFSIANGEPGQATTFIFIDADRNIATGRAAIGAELDAALTSDPTEGGYDYVIKATRGANGTVTGALYRADSGLGRYVQVDVLQSQMSTEAGVHLDPLRINQELHGYIQSAVDLNLLGLTQTCRAKIFVRTTNQAQNLGVGDLIVGRPMDCVPAISEGNPSVVINPPNRCVSDAECPNNGICQAGSCELAHACGENADCDPQQTCVSGRCVYTGGAGCTSSGDCAGLVCQQGRCIACTTQAQCDAAHTCAPDGRCVSTSGSGGNQGPPSDAGDIALEPGERLQGGACACHAAGHSGPRWLSLVTVVGLALLSMRSLKGGRHT